MAARKPMVQVLQGKKVLSGTGAGEVLYSEEPISFMGGIDPLTGIVIDTHHPLKGDSVAGKVLVIPSGRGSCAGSGALFEMLVAGTAPAALVFAHEEAILTLGAIIADEFFQRSLPILQLTPEELPLLRHFSHATVHDGCVVSGVLDPDEVHKLTSGLPQGEVVEAELNLTAADEQMLSGALGPAAQAAMRVTVEAARLEGATELVDVEMAHIDGNFYQGPASLMFAIKLRDLGARVAVPSTMNSVKVDIRQWREQGVSADLGLPSEELAEAYVAMGVQPSYTCAPYQLDDAPKFGEQIAWAESNAVVYANSVLGARTLKYPDYLDILIAITGRGPAAGTHLPLARRAKIEISVEDLHNPDDSLYPILGYLVGQLATHEIPVITGLEGLTVSRDDLRAFGSAFATTSAAPMFHMVGATPEAETFEDAVGRGSSAIPKVHVTRQDLREARDELNSSQSKKVGLVAFGNPHFSLEEIKRLAEACDGLALGDEVELMVTCGRAIFGRATASGYVAKIERVGGKFLTDTCWCLIQEPVIPVGTEAVMTNSAKYAHYGPAQVGAGMHFGSFAECVEAARTGLKPTELPGWLLE